VDKNSARGGGGGRERAGVGNAVVCERERERLLYVVADGVSEEETLGRGPMVEPLTVDDWSMTEKCAI
jgi:hypothetical protein